MNYKIIVIILITILLIAFLVNVINNKKIKLKKTSDITIVPTMSDTITTDSVWCGTFQLVWNDMKNEVVKKDIEFNPQLDVVKNLNKEEFNTNMLSEEYYYKIYGIKSLELKEQIKKDLKEKFNQNCDMLEDINWSESNIDNSNNQNISKYFFYTMLYRKFEFLQEFDKLENGIFGKKFKDVKYFGIDKNTNNSKGKQIDVLYYNSKEDFAILINTKTADEIIFCKNGKGNNFNDIYNNMNNESNKYRGSKIFEDVDEFKAPNLTFDEEKEYTELENKPFYIDYSISEITKALQTVKFTLDEKGGEIKSESGVDVILTMPIDKYKEKNEPRYFYLDDTFTIFLREKGKNMPYFAGRIDNIKKFQ